MMSINGFKILRASNKSSWCLWRLSASSSSGIPKHSGINQISDVNQSKIEPKKIFFRGIPIGITNGSHTKLLQLTSVQVQHLSTTHRKSKSLQLMSTFVEKAPADLQPYMKLMRMDKPIGSWLLFWPCGWSLGLAAHPGAAIPDPALLGLFTAGALIMRGAGCTINDMWDKNIDYKVKRTQTRPITSGQLTMFDALVFLGGQLGLGLLVLLQLNWYSVLLGAASMGLVVLYPVAKRFTYWPQAVLGLAFNWGALLGWSAVDGECNWAACIPLYIAGVSWTMIYDTIYAHQDKFDDIILGIKSTALKFGDKTNFWLAGFATTMTTSLCLTGWICEQTWPFYTSVALVAAHLARQISTLDINNSEDCAAKFVSNRRVGLVLFLGIVLGTYVKDPTTLSLAAMSASSSGLGSI